MNRQPATPSRQPDPALVLGCVVAVGLLAIEFISFEGLSGFFGHPRLILDGVIPEHTRQGITLLYMMLPMAAIAWAATPLVSRWIGQTPPPQPEPVGRRNGWILLGLIFVGGLLRVLRLEESLWYDEIAALTSFSIYGPGPALGNYYALSNHVLHSALVSMSTEVAGGVTEPVIRTPAFLFGILTIPAGYLLGREAC